MQHKLEGVGAYHPNGLVWNFLPSVPERRAALVLVAQATGYVVRPRHGPFVVLIFDTTQHADIWISMNFVTPGGSVMHGTGGPSWVFWGIRTGGMQNLVNVLPGIPIPRIRVNKGIKEGRGCYAPAPVLLERSLAGVVSRYP